MNEKPAFPQAAGTGNLEDWRHGMLLRDHFAGLAMQMRIRGLISCTSHPGYYSEHYPSWAQDAYAMADAMLKAREES